ncbi:MAG: hypothetical protein MJ155_02035 [Candidatus Saccharibacteria bacterium]|nr:hypothetical protein [Candidatus Saccharibacteria bacterium]
MDERIEELLPFIAFGAFFAIVGLFIFINTLRGRVRARKNCTVPVVARCVRISDGSEFNRHPDEPMDTDGAQEREIEQGEIVAPVFEIDYCGQTIELEPKIYSNICNTQVGEVRNMYVNPADPKKYYDPKDERSLVGILELLIAFGFIVFGTLFAILPVIFTLAEF